MKKYWWIVALIISFGVYNTVALIFEKYFPSSYVLTNLIASFFGIFIVGWFFRNYFIKK